MRGYFLKLKLRACNKTLARLASPKPGAPQLTSGLPTIRESRGGSNRNAECGHFYERRTFEMKPTSQSWQAAREEPQSRPLIRFRNENLDSTDKYNPTEICCGCKIPEFSRNLIFIIFIPKGIVVFTLTFNKGQCLFPSLIRD